MPVATPPLIIRSEAALRVARDTLYRKECQAPSGSTRPASSNSPSDLAEKAAARLDAPVVHLNYGDILLSLAEARNDDQAPAYFRRAVEQYDLVLKSQANSVEAVNNKAWILSRYLGRALRAWRSRRRS